MFFDMWRLRVVRRSKRRRTRTKVDAHYLEHKEAARELVLARLAHFNQYYGFSWNRVSIKNQRRSWGSCSAKKNLNFNYKILFLPPHLQDYIVVHELCHLMHLHHRQDFWHLVAEQIPDYRNCRNEIKIIDRSGHREAAFTAVLARYQSYAKEPATRPTGAATNSPRSSEFSAQNVA